mmetsp:Transcript_34344/g.85100  ORF Transcript_34344/g.85100 Transcript_34344/m.85100 type:complete len:207 (+) Transcript_34344:268-888(+)
MQTGLPRQTVIRRGGGRLFHLALPHRLTCAHRRAGLFPVPRPVAVQAVLALHCEPDAVAGPGGHPQRRVCPARVVQAGAFAHALHHTPAATATRLYRLLQRDKVRGARQHPLHPPCAPVPLPRLRRQGQATSVPHLPPHARRAVAPGAHAVPIPAGRARAHPLRHPPDHQVARLCGRGVHLDRGPTDPTMDTAAPRTWGQAEDIWE